MSSPVDKSELPLPPAYIAPSPVSYSTKNHGNAKYIIAGLTIVVVAAIVTTGVLVGLHFKHSAATKDCIMEFSLSTTLNGKVETTRARIDPKNNEEDITTSHGKMRVLEDYNRGMTVMRMKIDETLACYLKTLNKTGIIEPKFLKNYQEHPMNEIDDTVTTYKDTLVYMVAKEPLNDRSIMSAHAQEICQGLDIFWLLPTQKQVGNDRIARRAAQDSCYLGFYGVDGLDHNWREICFNLSKKR